MVYKHERMSAFIYIYIYISGKTENNSNSMYIFICIYANTQMKYIPYISC